MEIAGELGAKVAVEAAMAIGVEAGKMSAINTGLGIGREVGRVAGAQAAGVAAAKDLAKMNMEEITQVENLILAKRTFCYYIYDFSIWTKSKMYQLVVAPDLTLNFVRWIMT